MISFDKALSLPLKIGMLAVSLSLVIGSYQYWKHSVKKEQLVEINQQTEKNEQAEIKADEKIKQDSINSSIDDVTDRLQSECRDCDEQGIRVQSTINYQTIPQRQFDGGYSTSNRYTEPDTQTQMQCTHKQMSECEPKYCCEL